MVKSGLCSVKKHLAKRSHLMVLLPPTSYNILELVSHTNWRIIMYQIYSTLTGELTLLEIISTNTERQRYSQKSINRNVKIYWSFMLLLVEGGKSWNLFNSTAKERLEEIKSMAVQVCSRVNIKQRRFVRNNIQPGTIVNFVYGNCGHNAESKHTFTLYATNGIIIQRTLDTSDESQHLPSPTSRQKRTNSLSQFVQNLLFKWEEKPKQSLNYKRYCFVFIISQH